MAPSPKPDSFVTDTPCIYPDLYNLAKAVDTSAGPKLYRVG